jgi:hypothetical protein
MSLNYQEQSVEMPSGFCRVKLINYPAEGYIVETDQEYIEAEKNIGVLI